MVLFFDQSIRFRLIDYVFRLIRPDQILHRLHENIEISFQTKLETEVQLKQHFFRLIQINRNPKYSINLKQNT